MLRVVLLNIVLFFLPFILYALYFYTRARRRNDVTIAWNEIPFARLLQAGVGLIIIGMLITAYVGGEDAGGTYVPARMEKGRLVPGEVQQ
ncbi:MAG: hypothetical protein EXR08_02615 [Alphaproteobacteria bacterium]|nr:hypothetical protein [Alphaproteobacteria bacterium]